MKLLKTVNVSLVAVALLVGINAFAEKGLSETKATNDKATNKTVKEEELGLRKVTIYSEEYVEPLATKYSDVPAGTSEKIERAYENAPPMISHSVDGMLPITKENNMCVSCHDKEVAAAVGATSIPLSHYMNLRTGEKLESLYQGRFNCSQCHAPQSQVEPAVANNFKPDYRKPDAKATSSLMDSLNEGVR